MGKERRRERRYDSRIFVELTDAAIDKDLGRGVMLDISRSGFRVETEADLAQEETYVCHMEVPLTFKARVVRREISGQMKRYGLQFTEVGFFDRVVLRKVLKGRLSTKKVG